MDLGKWQDIGWEKRKQRFVPYKLLVECSSLSALTLLQLDL